MDGGSFVAMASMFAPGFTMAIFDWSRIRHWTVNTAGLPPSPSNCDNVTL